MDDHIPPVVIDSGSGMCKAGIAEEEAPRLVFPSIVGSPRNKKSRHCFVGDEAQSKRDMLSIKYPMDHGIVTNWDDMERIWHYVYSRLGVSSETQPVLMSDAPFNPKANREKMIQMMFETFNVPAFYVTLQGILSMYASGRNSAVMLDSGDGVTHVLSVSEGYTVPHAMKRVDFAGSNLTTYLNKMLSEHGYNFTTTSQREIVKDIKEKVCYVAEDFNLEMATSATKTEVYKLPDGTCVNIGNERFRTPECLFRPSLAEIECPGIHELVNGCVMDCDIDLRPNLYCNVIVSGGSTMFPGFDVRLRKELLRVMPSKSLKLNVIATSERCYNVWIGGSILASLTTFQTMLVSRDEYNETGPEIVNRRCL